MTTPMLNNWQLEWILMYYSSVYYILSTIGFKPINEFLYWFKVQKDDLGMSINCTQESPHHKLIHKTQTPPRGGHDLGMSINCTQKSSTQLKKNLRQADPLKRGGSLESEMTRRTDQSRSL